MSGGNRAMKPIETPHGGPVQSVDPFLIFSPVDRGQYFRNGNFGTWWHFTAIDMTTTIPDYEASLIPFLKANSLDENVDLEKGVFDYLMGWQPRH